VSGPEVRADRLRVGSVRGRPSTARIALARTGLELRQFVRERDAMAFVFAYPIVMLVIFGSIFGGQRLPDGTPFSHYFLAGIVATGIVLTSFQSLAVGIAGERDDGTLKRLRGMAVPALAYVLGKVGMVLTTSIVQVALLLLVARVGYDVPWPGDLTHWARFGWVFALGTVAGTVLGVAFSAVPASARSATAVTAPVVIVLQFFSGVFFTLASLPGWMLAVAEVFPLKWMAQGLRAALLPEGAAVAEPGGDWGLGTGALVMAAWCVLGLLLCLRSFRWTRKDR
jgi:ABC-2 type transport system permease protein